MITALSFWSLAGLNTWGRFASRSLAMEVGGAVTSTVLAGMAWRERQRERREEDRRKLIAEYERREEVFIRVISSQLGGATTGPMRRLKSV